MAVSALTERAVFFKLKVFQGTRNVFENPVKLGKEVVGTPVYLGTEYKALTGGLDVVQSNDKGIRGKLLACLKLCGGLQKLN
jgi:hypothetical protein